MLVHHGHNDIESLLNRITDSRPFTHQVDIVLISSLEQSQTLSNIVGSYYRANLTFSALFKAYTLSSSFTALTVGDFRTEDAWCLDTRGILSLSLTRTTYERLGINAELQSKTPRNQIRPLIHIDLKDKTSLSIGAKERLKEWDSRREAAGEGGWQVLLSSDFSSSAIGPDKKHDITPSLKSFLNVTIPSQVLPLIKSDNAKEEVAHLFEWFGLACIGSQRLSVNDGVNQYAAVYTPPANSSSGSMYHLRWSGLLLPSFVRSILESLLLKCAGLRGISALSFNSPVSYITSTGSIQGGENIWTLMASEGTPGSTGNDFRWLLAENT